MKLVRAEDIEAVVRQYLGQQGFELTAPRRHGETGCDLVATRSDERLFIEVIGFQSVPPLRSREFFECFFRAISRDQDRMSDRLIMALPLRFARGMTLRKRQYGVAWEKIGKAFPSLELWYVGAERGEVIERSWTNCEVDSVREVSAGRQAEGCVRASDVRCKSLSRSLRGTVMQQWQEMGKPRWDVQETLRICEIVDNALSEQGRNPAAKFRSARLLLQRNQAYLKRWVLGCRFPWLKS